MAENVTVKWRTLAVVFAVLLGLSITTLVLVISLAGNYHELPNAVANRVEALSQDKDPTPTPEPSPSGTDLAPAPDLADQVAVNFSNSTGWPNQENQYDYVMGFTSVGDDLLVHTNQTDPIDLSDACTLLFQLNDPVLGLDPQIDQVLFTGTDGQVIWSCVTSSEVQ